MNIDIRYSFAIFDEAKKWRSNQILDVLHFLCVNLENSTVAADQAAILFFFHLARRVVPWEKTWISESCFSRFRSYLWYWVSINLKKWNHFFLFTFLIWLSFMVATWLKLDRYTCYRNHIFICPFFFQVSKFHKRMDNVNLFTPALEGSFTVTEKSMCQIFVECVIFLNSLIWCLMLSRYLKN